MRLEKTPFGIPVLLAALIIAEATNSPVPACSGCDFTTTGQPAASALAVSPPAVEKARGKLLAPKTATGPIGICNLRISGLPSVLLMMASTQEPSLSIVANALSCPVVLLRSPLALPAGRPDS
ncbi:hypothetical protein D3C84_962230 [compost metagenome]